MERVNLCSHIHTRVHKKLLLPACAVQQVNAANNLVARKGLDSKDVHFVVGDALAPALPDAAYDLVLAVESSTYMPDKE